MATAPALLSSTLLSRDDLFEVQREALRLAEGKDGFAFFLEQGLGKTRVVWYEFFELAVADEVDYLLVVCPRSLRGAWRDERDEIGLSAIPVILVDSAKKTMDEIAAIKKTGYAGPIALVMHYEQVLTHGTEILTKLLERHRRIYGALDESVRIKKDTSVIGERLFKLANAQEQVPMGGRKKEWRDVSKTRAPFKYRRVLSGTPAPQSVADLWNQFRYLGKMLRTPFKAFQHLYCQFGHSDNLNDRFASKKVVGSQNLDILKQRTGPFVFRAKKVDWAKDLPEKLYAHPREVEMHPTQRQAYRDLMNDMVLELGPDKYLTVEMAVTVKNKLQQISSGWVFDNDKVPHEIVPLADNPKMQEARALIEECSGKILVFYYFRETRRYLEMLAEDMGIGYVFLESRLNDAEFDSRKRSFNTDDSKKVAFCQLDAVKEGHTLLGTKTMPCHNTLFVENNYSLYARAQAEDRNHRHGQKYPVTYHDIAVSREDRTIIRALQTKATLMEALMSEFTSYDPTIHVEEGGGEEFDL